MAKTLQLASVNRMPGMFKRFSRLLPRLFRRLSLPFTFGPSIRVFTRRPSDSHAPSSGGSSHRVEPSVTRGRALCRASPVFHINTNPTNCRPNTCKFA